MKIMTASKTDLDSSNGGQKVMGVTRLEKDRNRDSWVLGMDGRLCSNVD